MRKQHRIKKGLVLGLLAAVVLAGCGSDSDKDSKAGTVETPAKKVTLRLGYFPNITHASAVAGVETGIFAEKLGPNVTLSTSSFNAGPAAMEAIFSGAIDATYVGPNPAINAYSKSNGEAIRIVSGATSGGAFLVVKPEIAKPADLKGKKIASPQLGNTQDVALRNWLKENGLNADQQGGGDVSVLPQENATAIQAFAQGAIDGAWVPEPWVTRLVQEGGGKVLVDEKELWDNGDFVTTHLIVRTAFLEDHPDAVRRLLQGQVEANELVNRDPQEARRLVNQGIAELTGKGLADEVIRAAWQNLEFTNDPIASSLATSARHASELGLLEKVDLAGIYDLQLLNQVLRETNRPEVQG